MFHANVATQPLMSTIARVARGTPALPSVADKALDLLGTARDRLSAEFKGQRHSEQLTREQRNSFGEDERRKGLIMHKARELIFTWGEGFEHYEEKYPLFHQTYTTLINEGVDFSEMTVNTPAMLETPSGCVHLSRGVPTGLANDDLTEDEALAQALAMSMKEMNGEGPGAIVATDDDPFGDSDDEQEPTIAEAAHASASALAEVVEHHSSEGFDDHDKVVLDALREECEEKQQQMAAAVEAAITQGDDTILMGVLAANEALTQALQMEVTVPQIELAQEVQEGTLVDLEDDVVEKEQQKEELTIESIEDFIKQADSEMAHANSISCEEEEEKEEQKESETETHDLLGLDFFDQGNFASEAAKEVAATEEPEGVQNSDAPGTTPMLPDL